MRNRRNWKIVFVASLLSFMVYIFYMITGTAMELNEDILSLGDEEVSTLPLPDVLEDQNSDLENAIFYLTARRGTKEFLSGQETGTFGYNGDFLGPVIRVKKGGESEHKGEK